MHKPNRSLIFPWMVGRGVAPPVFSRPLGSIINQKDERGLNMYQNSQTAKSVVRDCKKILGASSRPINERYEVIKIEGNYQYALVDSETLEGVYSDDLSLLERFANTMNTAHVRAVRQGLA